LPVQWCQNCTLVGTRTRKKRKPATAVARPLRRSLYLPVPMLREVLAQAKLEERRPSDMIRVLIQRGLRASRAPEVPPSEG
jgi:hypothetical protein